MATGPLSPTAALRFALRDTEGHVTINYSVNDNPQRWGFDLLGLNLAPDAAKGFPVIQAKVAFSREGYAGLLGWVQVVDYTVVRDDVPEELVWVVPDVAPQLRDANTPYLAFGIEPIMFDAPAFTEKDVDWTARTFLTYTPDCLITTVVEPLCGFRWGYVIRDGVVTPKTLAPCSHDDWIDSRRLLQVRLPTWTFGGDDWRPPAFEA